MAFEFKFPDVGEGIHEGKIISFLVKEGDFVKLDQPLIKIETDKAVVDLPSPREGKIVKIHFKDGDIITVGQTLFTIEVSGEDKKAEPAVIVKTEEARIFPMQKTKGEAENKSLATPRIRALARKLGVDISTISGTGPHERITDDDIEKASKKKQEGFSSKAVSPTVEQAEMEERIKITMLRKRIVENMTKSNQIIPHVTHVDEADVSNLWERYSYLKESLSKQNINLTILPFFIKAICLTLKEHPLLNSSFDEENGEIILKHYYNIGIAVDTPDGLIVPVLKYAERKNIVQIAEEISDLSKKARERTISLEEIRNGTFTITNLGTFGGLFATPIILHPQAAILGMNAINERAVVRDGKIVIRKMINIGVSFDHRIIDGAEAARFMKALILLIENPDLIFVRL